MPQSPDHIEQPGGEGRSGNPGGESAGDAVRRASKEGVEDVEAKIIGENERSNPEGATSGGGPNYMEGVMEVAKEVLRAGGKEVLNAATDYIREGDLRLFTGSGGTAATSGQEPPGEQIPEPSSFRPNPGGGESTDPAKTTQSENDSGGAPMPMTGAGPDDLRAGDIARVDLGKAVVWAEVVGPSGGADDYEGRLESESLGLPEGEPVTFSARHVVDKVGEAPDNPTPETPNGIRNRTRANPGQSDGPLPPRF